MVANTETRKTRFLGYLKLNEASGCLEWSARRYPSGYGQFYWGVVAGKEKAIKAHRAAWLLFRGPVAEGMQVLHKCHNAACCNVEHLYVGTHEQNMRDRDEAGHTSKWNHRYNFRRSPELIAAIKDKLPSGKNVATICKELGIGWQTFYRSIDQDAELAALVKRTKSLRYQAGSRSRMAA